MTATAGPPRFDEPPPAAFPPVSESSLLQKCCLIGESPAGDPTHFMVQRALDTLGLDWRFMSFQTDPARAAEALIGADALGFRGVRLRGAFCSAGVAPAATERAKRTGRVSHLTRHDGLLLGDDATGPALVEALVEAYGEWGEPNGKRVLVLGAGGAAPSVVDVLVERGASHVAIADLSSERSAALVHKAQTNRGESSASDALTSEITTVAWDMKWIDLPDRVDWVLSSASWPKEENDAVARVLTPELNEGQLVIDLGVGSSRSPLLLAAENRGATPVDGLPVLVSETALAVEAWTGAEIDRTVLRDAAEEFLGV